MGKAVDKFAEATKLQLAEIMARYPFPGSREPERTARIEAELSAIKQANPSLDELMRQVAELKVGAQMMLEGLPDLYLLIEIGVKGWKAIEADKSETGRRGAEALHKENKGKREKLHEVWASGRYRTRDSCAEREHKNLDVSFATARRWLRRTPEPMRRKT